MGLSLFLLEMSDSEGEHSDGVSEAPEDMKSMLGHMLKEFKTDMLNSVEEMIDNRLYEQAVESDQEEQPGNLVDVNALMNSVIAGNEKAKEASQSSSQLDTLLNKFNPEKSKDPPVNEKLAVLINSLLKDGLSKHQLTMKEKYLRPENCPTLDTPKVNSMLWAQLKQCRLY